MAKQDPRAEKRLCNEAFALRHGRKKKKSTKRKERHARTAQREMAWLLTHGAFDYSDGAAPVA